MVFEFIKSQIKTTAVSVGTTATALPSSALTGRISMLVANEGATTVYLGNSSVTTANGIPLAAGAQTSMDLGANVPLYGIVSSGTADVRVMEGL